LYLSSRTLRSSDQGPPSGPQSRLKTKADRAFAFMAPKLWNSLPSNLRSLDSVDSFKKQLKAFQTRCVVLYIFICTFFLSVALLCILFGFMEFILCFIVKHFERCYINKCYLLA
ncbi:hypothetical protein LDENG_00281110, partial [Lucifuga dentata]